MLSVLIFYFLAGGRTNPGQLKALVAGLILSEVYDLLWFASTGSVSSKQGWWSGSPDQERSVQGFSYFMSLANFLLKLPVTIVVWKVSQEAPQG